ncbi:MAG: hypothetical protein WBF39_11680, partial [Planococcus donghaensis]
MSKLRYKEGGVWKSIAPSQKEFDDFKTDANQQLADKLNKGEVSVSDINKNLGKFDQTYMSDAFLQQMTGTTPVNAIPADLSITTIKLADKAVGLGKLSDGLQRTVDNVAIGFDFSKTSTPSPGLSN